MIDLLSRVGMMKQIVVSGVTQLRDWIKKNLKFILRMDCFMNDYTTEKRLRLLVVRHIKN
jgi:hypothetical protein